MREYGNFFVVVFGKGNGIFLGALCGLGLSACMHAAPAMLNERMAVISGRGTVGDNVSDATRKTLIKAAAMTLDHGFRYFQIVEVRNAESIQTAVTTIQSGVDVTIKVYRVGEINPHAQGYLDAELIAAGELPIAPPGRITPAAIVAPSNAQPPANANLPKADCTVYGCTW